MERREGIINLKKSEKTRKKSKEKKTEIREEGKREDKEGGE